MRSMSVIVDAVRSPMGVKKGQMIGMRADDLAAQVVDALFERVSTLPRDKVEDVVLGCAFPEHTQGMLMARGVALRAGLPKDVGGKVVNRFCGSSMDAVHQLSQAIIAGDLECGIAVGVEDMFAIPMGGFNPSFHPKLYEMDLHKLNAEKQAMEDSKSDIGWGSQIRSYVLDQSRIKDLRTNVESSNTQAVLDGDINQFIEASLKSGL